MPVAGVAMTLHLWAVILLCLPLTARADQLPLWEAGAGIAALTLPDYRGSSQQHQYLLPLPYLVYRGEILKVDRTSLRALMFQSDRIEFGISGNASPPVDSDKNHVRRGMPDLDTALEIGPSLQIRLAQNEARTFKTGLILPLRAVLATNLSRFRQVGFVFGPKLNFDWTQAGPDRSWNFAAALGPLFADDRYHAYYYSVAPVFATPARRTFSAGAGYSGSQLTLTASRRFGQFWFGAFVRADDIHGATFADSPLVKTRDNFSAGFALAWVFAVSKNRVEGDN